MADKERLVCPELDCDNEEYFVVRRVEKVALTFKWQGDCYETDEVNTEEVLSVYEVECLKCNYKSAPVAFGYYDVYPDGR